mmetsp:Transcript_70455/g.206633  ORF Transcript_70455/g.206633 Transcript_70455/m.206633 type:complete len:208 (+) Transcript_70455:562-1185(+)
MVSSAMGIWRRAGFTFRIACRSFPSSSTASRCSSAADSLAACAEGASTAASDFISSTVWPMRSVRRASFTPSSWKGSVETAKSCQLDATALAAPLRTTDEACTAASTWEGRRKVVFVTILGLSCASWASSHAPSTRRCISRQGPLAGALSAATSAPPPLEASPATEWYSMASSDGCHEPEERFCTAFSGRLAAARAPNTFSEGVSSP